MRTPNRFTKTVLAVALGGMALTACGTEGPTGGAPAEASAVGVGASKAPAPKRSLPSDGLATHPDPEARYLAVSTRILDDCDPTTPVEPTPEGTIPPRRSLPEDGPVPLEAPEPPSDPEPAPTRTGPVEEVPLDPLDKCAGDAHAERILTAFDGTGPADHAALRQKLTSLDYPPSRIHRMPDHDGSPRARLDLRFMGNNLALEITGTRDRVSVEPFGAPETEDVRITEVRRKQNPAASTS
ncbi:hypothetical protein ACOZE3_06685 [Streptomyces cinereoruber]|uniref:hypothetical protein n=1 Tax=Streptomyces cinereoruber TaxID=67260 RepID=UPI003BF54439